MKQSVIPPWILRKIIDNGSAQQQSCARSTLAHVQTLMAENQLKPAGASKAQTGQVQREIYDAKNTQTLPGTLVRREGQPDNDDVASREAYDYLGVTYNFFWRAWQRKSLDN